ncbi:hypothetical protein Q7P37_003265 [Cladosporium fusiforme]
MRAWPLQLATGKMGGAESTALEGDGLQVQPPAGAPPGALGSQCTLPSTMEASLIHIIHANLLILEDVQRLALSSQPRNIWPILRLHNDARLIPNNEDLTPNAMNAPNASPTAAGSTSGLYAKLGELQIRLLKLHTQTKSGRIQADLNTTTLPVLPFRFRQECYLEELDAIVDKLPSVMDSGHKAWEPEFERWRHIQFLWQTRRPCQRTPEIRRWRESTDDFDAVTIPFENVEHVKISTLSYLYCEFAEVKFLLTSNGGLCLGLSDVSEGDEIVMLFGSESAVGLRPQGEHWHFLGPVYVDPKFFKERDAEFEEAQIMVYEVQ